MTVAKIALSAATFAIDRPYSYRVPPALAGVLQPGMRVLVPFGTGNRTSEGLVLSVEEAEGGKLKEIVTLLDETPVLTPQGIQLALWMRERFFCTVYAAALTMLPTGLWYVLKESYALAPGIDRETWETQTEGRPRAHRILTLLQANGGRAALEQIQALEDLPNPRQTLRELEKAGLVVRQTQARRKVKDKTEPVAALALSPQEALAQMTPRKTTSPMGYAVTSLLCNLGSASVKELCYFTGASRQTIKSLEKRGILTLHQREVFRHTLPETVEVQPLADLNPQQQAAYAGLRDRMESGQPQAALLYGVTGSGKTQVYLHLIQAALAAGRGAMVLVPEIALTPSLLQIFLTHFGRQVAVLHSCLPTGERYDEWKRVRDGQASVVIGTRSAVFAPLPDPGLIILDEEQEGSYQSESMVRYHAREVAKFRCTQHKGLLVLGSATPAIESRYAAETGQYHLFTLTQRYNAHPLPQVFLADMRQELRRGNATGLSAKLREELEENLARGEQTILFLNRRGNSRMALCSDCGEAPTCPRCSVHLTYHSANGRLMCHYCGYSVPYSRHCPSCGSDTVTFRGAGTQRAEEQLQQLLPEARVLRVDTDSVAAKYSLEKKLDQFARGEYDVMVGTQMVAKGLDFENVTLVGVLSADQALFSDDFRSNERTFDLLTQVVGRAGRGKYPGRAIIQTYAPENPVLHLAAQQDYFGFYRQEILFRQAMLYPPFVDILVIGFVGEKEPLVRQGANAFLHLLGSLAQQEYSGLPLRVLQPSPAAVARVSGKYRYKLLIKCRNSPRLREMVSRLLLQFASLREFQQVTAYADPNPYRIL